MLILQFKLFIKFIYSNYSRLISVFCKSGINTRICILGVSVDRYRIHDTRSNHADNTTFAAVGCGVDELMYFLNL